jgi:hypothetical protein
LTATALAEAGLSRPTSVTNHAVPAFAGGLTSIIGPRTLIVRPFPDDGCMGSAAVTKAYADINAAIAVLIAEADSARLGASDDADPLQSLANHCLDILAGIPGAEARLS